MTVNGIENEMIFFLSVYRLGGTRSIRTVIVVY